MLPNLLFRRLHKLGPSVKRYAPPQGRAAAAELAPPVPHQTVRVTVKISRHPGQTRRPYGAWCSSHLLSVQWTVGLFFQCAHSVRMYFDASGIQTHDIDLDLDDPLLLQLKKYPFQHTVLRPAVYSDIDHVPIPVFFGRSPPFAPILHQV